MESQQNTVSTEFHTGPTQNGHVIGHRISDIITRKASFNTFQCAYIGFHICFFFHLLFKLHKFMFRFFFHRFMGIRFLDLPALWINFIFTMIPLSTFSWLFLSTNVKEFIQRSYTESS